MLLAVQHSDAERRQQLVEREREIVDVKCLYIDERTRDQLRAVHQQVRTPLAGRLLVPASVGQPADGAERRSGTEEVRGTGAADNLGALVDERCQVLQIEFSGA